MQHMVEAVTRSSIVHVVENCIEYRQEVLQIPMMSENKTKLQEYQHHHQRIYEEEKIRLEPKQIIETMTK